MSLFVSIYSTLSILRSISGLKTLDKNARNRVIHRRSFGKIFPNSRKNFSQLAFSPPDGVE